MQTINSDLLLIQLQGNDQAAGTSISAYEAGLTTMVRAAKTTGDVLIITSQTQRPTSSCAGGPSGECTYDYQQSFTNAEYTVAAAQNVALFDFFKGECGTVRGTGTGSTCSNGGWSQNINYGWNGTSLDRAAADAAHLSVAGYNAALVPFLAQIITQ